MTKIRDENQIEIFDLLSIDWNKFKFNSNSRKHLVTQAETVRPYLIVFNEYGSIEFEDIIFLINNIENPLELRAGQELQIPALIDLRQFALKNRK